MRTPAQLATNPPTQPLATSEASGLPKRMRVMSRHINAEPEADKTVFAATSTTRAGAAPANRIAPAEFSPTHPGNANRQPNRTSTLLCPGIAAGMPSAEYLPRRGPRIHNIANALSPPTA